MSGPTREELTEDPRVWMNEEIDRLREALFFSREVVNFVLTHSETEEGESRAMLARLLDRLNAEAEATRQRSS